MDNDEHRIFTCSEPDCPCEGVKPDNQTCEHGYSGKHFYRPYANAAIDLFCDGPTTNKA